MTTRAPYISTRCLGKNECPFGGFLQLADIAELRMPEQQLARLVADPSS